MLLALLDYLAPIHACLSTGDTLAILGYSFYSPDHVVCDTYLGVGQSAST